MAFLGIAYPDALFQLMRDTMQDFENLPIKDRLILWLLFGETGISSETIACALSGVKIDTPVITNDLLIRRPLYYNTPSDAGDFRRCLMLLEYIPEWRERLPEVAERFPAWRHIVEHWDELEFLYEEGRTDIDPSFRKFRKRLMELRG